MKQDKPQKLYLTQILHYRDDFLCTDYYNPSFEQDNVDETVKTIFLGLLDFVSLFEIVLDLYETSSQEQKKNLVDRVIDKDGIVKFLYDRGFFSVKKKKMEILEEGRKELPMKQEHSRKAYEMLKEVAKEVTEKKNGCFLSIIYRTISSECDRACLEIGNGDFRLKFLHEWINNGEKVDNFETDIYRNFKKIADKHKNLTNSLDLMKYIPRDKKYLEILLETIKSVYKVDGDQIDTVINQNQVEQLKVLFS